MKTVSLKVDGTSCERCLLAVREALHGFENVDVKLVHVCSAYSGAIRPPIPVESGHLFRTNPATQSGPIRPPGPAHGDQRVG